jgi:cyclophilin family peptidyl-prolyl cis-trans isomerase
MARGPSKSSGSSSFFICLGDAPHLDGEYAVFGEVTKGMELLRELENVKIRQEG